MNAWWDGLSTEQQIYFAIASVASVVIALQLLLMLVGGGAEGLEDAGDADMDGPEDHPSGIALVSSRTVTAFLVGFGWTGLIVSRDGSDAALTATAAVTVGALFMAVVFYLMRFLYGLQHSGTLDYRNAIGETATVYLPVPAAMAGGGKVQVMIQGRLRVVQALTRHAEPLPNRARARVVDVLDDNTFVVEPLSGDTKEDF